MTRSSTWSRTPSATARASCRGGEAPARPGFFYPVTIVADVTDGMRIVDEEQFGPALPVIRYTDLEDAIARANGLDVGLGGSAWSSDVEKAKARRPAARMRHGVGQRPWRDQAVRAVRRRQGFRHRGRVRRARAEGIYQRPGRASVAHGDAFDMLSSVSRNILTLSGISRRRRKQCVNAQWRAYEICQQPAQLPGLNCGLAIRSR